MAEQKFTPRAENVLRLAQETALELGHGYVGCEHILLGLLREDGGAACRALGEAGVTEEQLREQLVRTVGHGLSGSLPSQGLTPRARSAVEMAVAEIKNMRHQNIYLTDDSLFFPQKAVREYAERFFDAVGGTDGERYYISMRTEKGDWELYVFDTLRAIWLREDATHALDWAYLDGTLYFLDGATGKLMTTGQDYSEEGLVNWSATLCQMDETSHGRKCYSKLYLRADLDAGAWLKVEISTDGKPFRQVFSTHNERAKTLQVPILPVRCDNFRIRLSGKGGCLVKSIIREFALGSEY